MTRGRDPTKVLAEAIGDLRVVGVVFAFAGSLLLGLHVVTRFGPLSADVFTIIWVFCNTIVLVGPGVWYVVAASILKRGQFWAATFSMRVAAGQGFAMVLLLVFGFERSQVAVPACVLVFFVPAMLAVLVHLNRVRRIIPMLSPGHAFEPIRVQPIAPGEAVVNETSTKKEEPGETTPESRNPS
jgi:hypothetical protein